MKRAILRILIGLSCFLAACQPVVYQKTVPPPEVWRVQVTPELRWLGKIFNSCTSQAPFFGNAAILLDEQAGTNPDFSFRWNPEDSNQEGYSAVLGQAGLALIVNPANPVPQLELADLQAIYSGQAADWTQVCKECGKGGWIQPLVYPDGNAVGGAFEAAFPGFNTGPADAVIVPDPQAVHDLVAANPQAIGFVPSVYVDLAVRQVKINGIDPQKLQFPLVVSAPSEPTGLKLAWLLCVQDSLK